VLLSLSLSLSLPQVFASLISLRLFGVLGGFVARDTCRASRGSAVARHSVAPDVMRWQDRSYLPVDRLDFLNLTGFSYFSAGEMGKGCNVTG
jgi:hypothetical protein